jgi:hypothetical protein
MLRVSPQQRPRLAEIIRNLRERITEARMNGWLGEVQGLEVSLEAANLNANSPASTEASNATAAPDPPTSECRLSGNTR